MPPKATFQQPQATADSEQRRPGGDGMLDGGNVVPVRSKLVMTTSGVGRGASVERWLDIFAAHDQHCVCRVNNLQHLLEA
ncbi:hypothetical protein AAHB37_01325 [Glutamicibacter halophytocola]